MPNITIIDTACANLSSVKFAFDRLGYAAEITRDLNKIKSADKLILPGVGTAIAAMKNLQDRGLEGHADGDQHRRPPRRGCLAPSRHHRILCLGRGSAHVARRQGHYRARFPAGEEDRGGCRLAAGP